MLLSIILAIEFSEVDFFKNATSRFQQSWNANNVNDIFANSKQIITFFETCNIDREQFTQIDTNKNSSIAVLYEKNFSTIWYGIETLQEDYHIKEIILKFCKHNWPANNMEFYVNASYQMNQKILDDIIAEPIEYTDLTLETVPEILEKLSQFYPPKDVRFAIFFQEKTYAEKYKTILNLYPEITVEKINKKLKKILSLPINSPKIKKILKPAQEILTLLQRENATVYFDSLHHMESFSYEHTLSANEFFIFLDNIAEKEACCETYEISPERYDEIFQDPDHVSILNFFFHYSKHDKNFLYFIKTNSSRAKLSSTLYNNVKQFNTNNVKEIHNIITNKFLVCDSTPHQESGKEKAKGKIDWACNNVNSQFFFDAVYYTEELSKLYNITENTYYQFLDNIAQEDLKYNNNKDELFKYLCALFDCSKYDNLFKTTKPESQYASLMRHYNTDKYEQIQKHLKEAQNNLVLLLNADNPTITSPSNNAMLKKNKNNILTIQNSLQQSYALYLKQKQRCLNFFLSPPAPYSLDEQEEYLRLSAIFEPKYRQASHYLSFLTNIIDRIDVLYTTTTELQSIDNILQKIKNTQNSDILKDNDTIQASEDYIVNINNVLSNLKCKNNISGEFTIQIKTLLNDLNIRSQECFLPVLTNKINQLKQELNVDIYEKLQTTLIKTILLKAFPNGEIDFYNYEQQVNALNTESQHYLEQISKHKNTLANIKTYCNSHPDIEKIQKDINNIKEQFEILPNRKPLVTLLECNAKEVEVIAKSLKILKKYNDLMFALKTLQNFKITNLGKDYEAFIHILDNQYIDKLKSHFDDWCIKTIKKSFKNAEYDCSAHIVGKEIYDLLKKTAGLIGVDLTKDSYDPDKGYKPINLYDLMFEKSSDIIENPKTNVYDLLFEYLIFSYLIGKF